MNLTLTITVTEDENVSVQTRARGVSEAQIRPALHRAQVALQAEINALEGCPYHVARERSDTGHRDRSDEQVPGNTPDQDQRP